MHVDHHDLYQEFPEFKDGIDALKTSNAYLEEHDMPIADFTLEDMKKQRVKLKDEIYHLLLAFRAGQQSVKA